MEGLEVEEKRQRRDCGLLLSVLILLSPCFFTEEMPLQYHILRVGFVRLLMSKTAFDIVYL